MSSVLISVLDAAVAALGATGKPSGFAAYRSGLQPKEPTSAPFAVVKAGKAKRETIGSSRGKALDNSVELVFVVYAARPIDTAVEDALDPYVTWIDNVIGNNPSLGGLLVRPADPGSVIWDVETNHPDLCAAVVIYQARYPTQRTNQEAQP